MKSRHTKLVATVATTMMLAGAGALTGAAQAATGETSDQTGWIRVGHLSPGTPKADVRLTPFAGGGTTTLAEAEFGDLSDYERVPVGLYSIALVEADAPESQQPMLSRNVEVSEGGAATVIATGTGDDVRTTVLQDDLEAPPEGQAKVRLISAAVEPDTVRAAVVDGPELARDLRTGAATGYADVEAQTWEVQLEGADGATARSRVPVRAGGVYTLVALDSPGGGLELRAVQDSSSSTAGTGAMPRGGVDAGGGGNAAAPGAPAAAPVGLLGAAVLALLGGAAVTLRRRGAV